MLKGASSWALEGQERLERERKRKERKKMRPRCKNRCVVSAKVNKSIHVAYLSSIWPVKEIGIE